MRSGDRQRGMRPKLPHGGGIAVLVALLLVLAWRVTGWVSDEQAPVPMEQRAAARSVAPAAAFSLDVAPPAAAAGRGALGLAPVAVEVLAGHPPTLAVRRWLGPGMSTDEFRALYEADPGDGADFMFMQRTPPRD